MLGARENTRSLHGEHQCSLISLSLSVYVSPFSSLFYRDFAFPLLITGICNAKKKKTNNYSPLLLSICGVGLMFVPGWFDHALLPFCIFTYCNRIE